MRRADIERAALDVYTRVFAGFCVMGAADPADHANKALRSALADLKVFATSVNKKQRVEAIVPTVGAKMILDAYKKVLPMLPQPEEPIQASVWAMLNSAITRYHADQWEKIFLVVRKSPFLMGKETHFSASLPWLLKPSVTADINAGKYSTMK